MSIEKLAQDWEDAASSCDTYDTSEAAAEAAVWRDCARELRETIRWVPVEERLPDVLSPVLVGIGKVILMGFFGYDRKWWSVGGNELCPTHWRPLPDPPEKP